MTSFYNQNAFGSVQPCVVSLLDFVKWSWLLAGWIYFLAKWLWYRLYIFLQSNFFIMSVMHILFFFLFVCFFLHESLFCTKGHSGQNDIFQLQTGFSSTCYQTSVNVGPHPVCAARLFLFQPERLQPNMLFTPPVSPLTVGVGLTFCRGPVAVFIQTLYAKWLSEWFLLSPRRADFSPCQRWPQSFVLNVRDASKGTFSL